MQRPRDASSPPKRRPDPGHRLVVVGGTLFVAGLAGVLANVAIFLVAGERDLPLALYLVSLLVPLGLGTALWGIVRMGLARRRPATPAGRVGRPSVQR